MVYFVGAGPGAADLITLRGDRLLRRADVVIWAGSLVNPALLESCREGCELHDSSQMTLEEVLEVVEQAHRQDRELVRLHTGDPSIYGAVYEQIAALEERKIPFEIVPGVSSFCAAAAALETELTLPGVSQTVILTRLEGRTPMPAGEQARALAAHGCTMVFFLSAGMLEKLREELLAGGYAPDTPAAIVYKATWPEEAVFRCTVETLAAVGKRREIRLTALVVVGRALQGGGDRSLLYHPEFSTLYRDARSGSEAVDKP